MREEVPKQGYGGAQGEVEEAPEDGENDIKLIWVKRRAPSTFWPLCPDFVLCDLQTKLKHLLRVENVLPFHSILEYNPA